MKSNSHFRSIQMVMFSVNDDWMPRQDVEDSMTSGDRHEHY